MPYFIFLLVCGCNVTKYFCKKQNYFVENLFFNVLGEWLGLLCLTIVAQYQQDRLFL